MTITPTTTQADLGASLVDLQHRHAAISVEGDALQAEIDVRQKRQNELEAESKEILARIQELAFGDLRRANWTFMRGTA